MVKKSLAKATPSESESLLDLIRRSPRGRMSAEDILRLANPSHPHELVKKLNDYMRAHRLRLVRYRVNGRETNWFEAVH